MKLIDEKIKSTGEIIDEVKKDIQKQIDEIVSVQ